MWIKTDCVRLKPGNQSVGFQSFQFQNHNAIRLEKRFNQDRCLKCEPESDSNLMQAVSIHLSVPFPYKRLNGCHMTPSWLF